MAEIINNVDMKKMTWVRAALLSAIFFGLTYVLLYVLGLLIPCNSAACIFNFFDQLTLVFFTVAAGFDFYLAKNKKLYSFLVFLGVAIVLFWSIQTIMNIVIFGNHCSGLPQGWTCL